MATKSTSRFVCQSCGDDFLRWEGQCRACGDLEQPRRDRRPRRPRARRGRATPSRSGPARSPVALADIGEADVPRLPTGIGELDRVLGGGLVPGLARPGRRRAGHRQVDAPPPGRGRRRRQPVLYATGEESAAQVRLRAGRLGLLEGDPGRARRGPRRARHRVDRRGRPAASSGGWSSSTRIQTATVDELDGAAGSVGQVRESTVRLMDFAKGEGIAVVLVGHVTKDGSIAGPKTLEHLVDAVDRGRGRALRRAAARPRGQEPLRLDRGGRRLRDGRRRPARGHATRPGPSWPSIPSRRRAASSRRPWRAAGRCSSRSRRWSRRPATARPARKASGIDPNRLGPARRRPGPARRDRPRLARRLRQPGRRPVRRRAGPRPADRPGPGLVAARPADRAGHGRHRRGRAARRAARGERPGAPPARGGPPRLQRRDRAAGRVAAPATPTIAGPARPSRSPRSARRSRSPLAGVPSAHGDALPGDARLTAGPRPAGRAVDRPEDAVDPLYPCPGGRARRPRRARARRGGRRAVQGLRLRRRAPRRLGRRLGRRRLRAPAVPDRRPGDAG